MRTITEFKLQNYTQTHSVKERLNNWLKIYKYHGGLFVCNMYFTNNRKLALVHMLISVFGENNKVSSRGQTTNFALKSCACHLLIFHILRHTPLFVAELQHTRVFTCNSGLWAGWRFVMLCRMKSPLLHLSELHHTQSRILYMIVLCAGASGTEEEDLYHKGQKSQNKPRIKCSKHLSICKCSKSAEQCSVFNK